MTAANQLILVLVKFEKDNKIAKVDEDKKNVPCKHDTLCQTRVKNVLRLRPRWSKYISSSNQNHSETITLRVLYTHIDHIREYPPGKYKNQPGTKFLLLASHVYKKSQRSCAKHRLAPSIRVSLMLSYGTVVCI